MKLIHVFGSVPRSNKRRYETAHSTQSEDGVQYTMPHLFFTVQIELSKKEYFAWILAQNSRQGEAKHEIFKRNAPSEYTRCEHLFTFKFSPPRDLTPSPEVVGAFVLEQAVKAFKLAGL